MKPNRSDFRWALAVLALSGAASLGHQLLWTRRVADLLGATGNTNARVFGGFFLGMSAGAAAASLLIPKLKEPWKAVGLIELAAAFFSLPVLLVNLWSPPLLEPLGPEGLLGWQGAWLKSVLSLAIVCPPAFFLGMTLPVVNARVCSSGGAFSNGSVRLYAVYTLGGALGVALVAGFALQRLGVSGSMLLMTGANCAAAALCFVAHRRNSSCKEESPLETDLSPTAQPPAAGPLVLLLSCFSGAGILGLEVAGFHLLNLKAPYAFYTPAAILFCVVILLALSAGAVALMPKGKRTWHEQPSALTICAALGGLGAALGPLIFLGTTAGQSGIAGRGSGLAVPLLQLAGVTCLSLGPALLFAGMVFPILISGFGTAQTGLSRVSFARLLASNGTGGLIGAEITQRLIIPAFGVHVALGMIGALYGILALGMTFRFKNARPWQLGFPAGSLAITIVLLLTVLREAPIFLRASTFQLLQVRSGPEGALAVAERPDVGRVMFLDNHYMLGSTAGIGAMQRQAHIPLLLHARPRNVCLVGLGTGITASGALDYWSVNSIDAVELSPLVVWASRTYFADFNKRLAANRRVRVLVEDARTYIAVSKGCFDVIIGDLFVPWRAGEARICTLEQFQAAKEALQPGGVFCQWLPLTQLTREHFEQIAGTFQKVFGPTYLFRNQLQSRSLPVALVGFNQGSLDWEVISRRCNEERSVGALRDPLARHPQGLALLYLGMYSPDPKKPQAANTLDNLAVELASSRHLLAGNATEYFAETSSVWLTFVQEQLAGISRRDDLPEPLSRLPRLGLDVATNLAAGREAFGGKLPSFILWDENADLSLLPELNRR